MQYPGINKTTRIMGQTINQPGANPQSRTLQQKDTKGERPGLAQSNSNMNKSKQEPENDHSTEGKTLDQLRNHRGGHGHSGHSSSRSGSDSNAS